MKFYFSSATSLWSGKGKAHGFRCREFADSYAGHPGSQVVLFREFYFQMIFIIISSFLFLKVSLFPYCMTNWKHIRTSCTGSSSKKLKEKYVKIFIKALTGLHQWLNFLAWARILTAVAHFHLTWECFVASHICTKHEFSLASYWISC